MAKKLTKKQKKEIANQVKKLPTWVIVTAVILLVVIGVGYLAYVKLFKNKPIPPVGELEIHFLTLGNKSSGDCIYIRAGDTDVLIDAGSDYDSIIAIDNYLQPRVSDGKIEYVIATHAHEDHIAAFAGDAEGKYSTVFDEYECETIIDFPRIYSNREVYKRYVQKRTEEISNGATHYTALQCWYEEDGAKRSYQLADSITMDILYNYYYEKTATGENNYSVCVQINHGSRKFLFTGDLEKKGEEYLVQYNATTLSQVEVFKAGHHGSTTSTNEVLLNVIKPKICVITCVAGYDEYTDAKDNQFPSQSAISNLKKAGTEKIYVTSIGDPNYTNGNAFADFNGNVVIISKADAEVYADCSSGNNTSLQFTDWFRANRVWA